MPGREVLREAGQLTRGLREDAEHGFDHATRVVERQDVLARHDAIPEGTDRLLIVRTVALRGAEHGVERHPRRELGEDLTGVALLAAHVGAELPLHEARIDLVAGRFVGNEEGVDLPRAARVETIAQVGRDDLVRLRRLAPATAGAVERGELEFERLTARDPPDLDRVAIGAGVAVGDEENIDLRRTEVVAGDLVEAREPLEDLLGPVAHRARDVEDAHDHDFAGRLLLVPAVGDRERLRRHDRVDRRPRRRGRDGRGYARLSDTLHGDRRRGHRRRLRRVEVAGRHVRVVTTRVALVPTKCTTHEKPLLS